MFAMILKTMMLYGVIHHEGKEYLYADDDLSISVNNIGNFTDYDHEPMVFQK